MLMHRVDRLVDTILTEYFPWYEGNQQKEARFDVEHIMAVKNGLRIWTEDCIRVLNLHNDVGERLPQRYSPEHPVYVVRPPPHMTPKLLGGTVGVHRDSSRQFCSCQKFEQTGKRCMHIWAVHKYRITGTRAEYEDKIAQRFELVHFARETAPSTPSRDFDHHISNDGDESDQESDDPLVERWGKGVHDPSSLFDYTFDGDQVAPPIVWPAVRPSPRPRGSSNPPCEPAVLSEQRRKELALEKEQQAEYDARRDQSRGGNDVATGSGNSGRPFGVTPGRPSHRKPNEEWRNTKRGAHDPPWREFAGATNPTNLSCYADTLHLLLYFVDPIRNRILSMSSAEVNHSEYLGVLHAMFQGWDERNHFDNRNLLDIMSSTKSKFPGTFGSAVAANFTGGPLVDNPKEQQDTAETLTRVLPYLNDMFPTVDFLEYFSVQIDNTRTCPKCCQSSSSITQTPHLPIYPPVKHSSTYDPQKEVSLSALLPRKASKDESSKVQCVACDFEGVGFTWEDKILGLPDYLALYISRQEYNTVSFKIPATFTAPSGGNTYKVTAVVVREAVTNMFGHYMILVRSPDTKVWWKINGTSVLRVSGPVAAFSGNCYPTMILCERESKDRGYDSADITSHTITSSFSVRPETSTWRQRQKPKSPEAAYRRQGRRPAECPRGAAPMDGPPQQHSLPFPYPRRTSLQRSDGTGGTLSRRPGRVRRNGCAAQG